MPSRATVLASGVLLLTALGIAPAHAADTPSKLDVPVFEVTQKGAIPSSTTTTAVPDGAIKPIEIPVSPVSGVTTTTRPAPITTPEVLGEGSGSDNTPTPGFDSNDDTETDLASTGFDVTEMAAFGFLLIGLGLGLWWFGGNLRTRALALRPSHSSTSSPSTIRSRRN